MLWIFELALFISSKIFYVTLNENSNNEDVLFINNISADRSLRRRDILSFVDKYINASQQLVLFHDFFKIKNACNYATIDFNNMIIDGSAISNNKSVKALIEVEKSLMINICNALLIHQRKPIFIFHQNSYISIINCTIINSQFNFIAELITISSSQIKILNCTLTNVIFNKTSLITSFQSLTEMIDINIHSSCFLDCSLINNVDGTFSFNKFSIINSTGHTSNIFDSVGTVYFMADDFILQRN